MRGKKLQGYGKLLAGQPAAGSCNMLDAVPGKRLAISQSAAFYRPFHRGFASQLVSSCDRKMPTLKATAINNTRACSTFHRGVLTLFTRKTHTFCSSAFHYSSAMPTFTGNSCLLLCENHFGQSECGDE